MRRTVFDVNPLYEAMAAVIRKGCCTPMELTVLRRPKNFQICKDAPLGKLPLIELAILTMNSDAVLALRMAGVEVPSTLVVCGEFNGKFRINGAPVVGQIVQSSDLLNGFKDEIKKEMQKAVYGTITPEVARKIGQPMP